MSILDTKPAKLQESIRTAPLLPGCYLYRNAKGKIIYVGKAKVLRNRVKSYFSNYNRLEPRIQNMVENAQSIDFLVMDSEIEALILELTLIKKYKPKYNSMHVDDKGYIYIKFGKIKASTEYQTLPKVEVTRQKDNDKADYFGPYPDSRAVRRLLNRLRRIYPFCESEAKVIIPPRRDQNIMPLRPKPCFNYHINMCDGVCAGLVTRGQYEDNLNNIKKFFEGKKHKLLHAAESQMQKAAKKHEYELAAKYRNMISDIKYVGSYLKLDKDIDEVMVMKEKQDKKQQALAELIERLGFPKEVLKNHPGFRIECYDISNIQGKFAVGSMVVSVDGEPKPDLYRRFRIQMKNEPNDFGMLREVLTRRFNQYLRSKLEFNREKRSAQGEMHREETDLEGFTIEITPEMKKKVKTWTPDPSFSQTPDLIIIDGGKGQLSSTYKILTDYGLANLIPMVGLAKREEEIFKISEQFGTSPGSSLSLSGESLSETSSRGDTWRKPIDSQEFLKVLLPRRSQALYLVQRIRDEAHRFAITYHRNVRSKAFVNKN